MIDSTIDLLRDLIAVDSVNPSLVVGGAGESQIAQLIANRMRCSGLDVEITEVTPGRPNVIGVIDGHTPGKTLMFCGHTDTVGVESMERPFDPVLKDGRVYGRGAGDMKGGVAAMIDAAGKISRSGGIKAGRLVVAAVVDEEYASIGSEDLVKNWQADAAVVTEPTDLLVSTAHKGFSWITITTAGTAAHGSRPIEGRDAIMRMGRVLSRLEQLDRSLQSRLPHNLLGTPSLHASLINGGRELSTYPDRCDLQVERRTLPGESPDIALHEVEEILFELSQEDDDFRGAACSTFTRLPYETPPGHQLPDLLGHALNTLGHHNHRAGMTYWTDAAVLGAAGIPSVVFGPGGFGYHGLNEYVLTEDVNVCRDALVELARCFSS